MNNSTYSPRRTMRMIVVMVVYSYEVLNQKPNVDEIFEKDVFDDLFDYEVFKKFRTDVQKEQYKIIGTIEKNYDLLVKAIEKYTREDWIWSRMNPLLRAILLCASIELWKLDIGIVTNEYVEITKDFFPESNEYKFVNNVIEKIGRIYHEYKNKKND